MKGKFVVDGGIKKGGATIQISLKPTQSKLCFEFTAKKLDPIIYGAVHKGAEGGQVPSPATRRGSRRRRGGSRRAVRERDAGPIRRRSAALARPRS